MKRGLAIGLAIWACAACAQQRSTRVAAPATSYQVTGVVSNAVTGEPLGGVMVMLGPSVASRTRAGNRPGQRSFPDDTSVIHSAPDGSFAFEHLPPGKYSLSAESRGFAQQAFDQHEQYSSAIMVGPEKDSTGVQFRLQPDASISGSILDDHNEPVMNATVMLFRAGIQEGRRGIYRVQQANSNDLGHYHFAHLRPGKYYVVVSATPWYAENARFGAGFSGGGGGGMGVDRVRTFSGGLAPGASNPALDVAYPLTFYPGVTESADAEPITLTPGVHQDADFSLTRVPALHVRVQAPGGDSQQNVMAMMSREVFGTQEFSGNIRNINYGQGVTEMSGVTPGRYFLQLRGFSPDRGNRLIAQREIDVTGDMEINAADVSAGANVSGTVKFTGDAPTGPVRLVVRRMGMPSPPIQVNAKGDFSTEEPLAPGKYEIFLPLPNYQITKISAAGGKLDGQSITIAGDDVHLNIEAAKASAQIQGTARKTDKGFAGAMVVLVPQDMSRPTLYRRDQSDSDGTFLLASIPPGTYTVVAIENGWDLEWSNPDAIRHFLAAGEKVKVAVDGDYHVDTNVQEMPGAPSAQPR